ncbi:plasma kallikrein-like protein [Lates japonicus]|uniref:Plasma kallikrein-like protein n=1 Tax=Lates japonicus TaxID=270547 RepID=A0AAD3RNB1_LATJO|nr:plasma kallikrein-like protein [Lates japonicus]
MGVHFISVALLCLCGLSFSQGCDHQLQENLDFPGSDIAVLFSPDADHCQYLCTQHPACLFFSFIRPDCTVDNRHFHCFLKSTPSGQPKVQVAKQGITSGFSLRSCHPDPSRSINTWTFYGADYRQLFTADYEECQRACTHDPACQFFTFLTDDFTPEKYRYKCHLKFSWPVPRTPEVVAEADVVSGFSHSGQSYEHFSTDCEGKLFPKTNLPGHDIESLLAASPDHCQTLCSAHPQCSYFSYDRNNFKCYLKNNMAEMVATAEERVTSGLPTRFCQLDNKYAMKTIEGINLPGSDLRFLLVNNAKACRKTCTEDPNCQFYTYAIADRRCYLKRVITMPAPPKVTKLANAVSGFSLRNCHY